MNARRPAEKKLRLVIDVGGRYTGIRCTALTGRRRLARSLPAAQH